MHIFQLFLAKITDFAAPLSLIFILAVKNSRRMHGYSTHPLLLFVGAFGGRSPLGYMHPPLIQIHQKVISILVKNSQNLGKTVEYDKTCQIRDHRPRLPILRHF
jgi:hypothetical protein